VSSILLYFYVWSRNTFLICKIQDSLTSLPLRFYAKIVYELARYLVHRVHPTLLNLYLKLNLLKNRILYISDVSKNCKNVKKCIRRMLSDCLLGSIPVTIFEKCNTKIFNIFIYSTISIRVTVVNTEIILGMSAFFINHGLSLRRISFQPPKLTVILNII
jgi:hypothetical protein